MPVGLAAAAGRRRGGVAAAGSVGSGEQSSGELRWLLRPNPAKDQPHPLNRINDSAGLVDCRCQHDAGIGFSRVLECPGLPVLSHPATTGSSMSLLFGTQPWLSASSSATV